MQLTFLGTGAGMPTKGRNVSSIALTWLNSSGEVWLFDCGEATQHQILYTSIKPSKISRIFITHLHGDHIYGLLGLLSSRSFLNGTTPLYLYGPVGIRSFVENGLRVSGTHLNYQLVIKEMSEGMEWSTDRATVIVRSLQHGIPSFGYRICEHDKVGPLQIEKLHALHIPKGPHFKLLKKGVDVSLQDGRVLKAKDFVGPKQKGRVVTILGDTRPTEASIELAKDADVCVHEATFSEREKEHAKRFFHSTTKEAATIAVKAHVKNLILTHISARFQGEKLLDFQQEAKQFFPSVTIASDFLTYTVSS